MADVAVLSAPNKVVNLSVTVNPRHHELVEEIRRARAVGGHDIPNKSDIVKQAIEELARQELTTERFDELMAGAA